MTMTDWNHTDHEVAGAGEPPATSSRRRKRDDPQYLRSALTDPRFRKLIAGILEDHVAGLLGGAPSTGDQFIAEQLDEFVNELRDV